MGYNWKIDSDVLGKPSTNMEGQKNKSCIEFGYSISPERHILTWPAYWAIIPFQNPKKKRMK